MNIKLLYLKNGLELVSDCEDNGETWLLKKPVMIGLVNTVPGQPPQLRMSRFCPLAKREEFDLPKGEVLFVSEPIEDVENGYNQQFGSGLVTTKPGIVVPQG
jgi:hypothetical protein